MSGNESRGQSPRNRFVAGEPQERGLAILVGDLLTGEEEAVDARAAHLRFDTGLPAEQLVRATDCLAKAPSTRGLKLGYSARARAEGRP
jgi:hypothetical protein